MSTTRPSHIASRQGAEDSGQYFRYVAEFVGFKPEDADIIRQTKPVIEQHLSDIVSKFYAHLLRYPPTRQWFLKPDGSIDQAYLELRMRHLTNFWLRTADAVFDDEYARYIDYVGRAHTSHGADPKIYIAERYVIGQVGFMSHAISDVIIKELHPAEPDLAFRAEEAWDNLMMVLLEMLSRAYGNERTAETFEMLLPVDKAQVEALAKVAYERERDNGQALTFKRVAVAHAADIPNGERKIVTVDGLSIGVFHHQGHWYALRNSCLHRGGPVCTGALEGDTLICPWHGFEYDLTTGKFLNDPSAQLDTYPVFVEDGEVVLQVPETHQVQPGPPSPASHSNSEINNGRVPHVEEQPSLPAEATPLSDNEFKIGEVPPGSALLVGNVAVFNVAGKFCAIQDECTHKQGPLSDGELDGEVVTCPYHGAQFNVCSGKVLRGPAEKDVKTYRVEVDGEIGRVIVD